MNHLFADARGVGNVKKTYKSWAVKLHPDKGGRVENFQALQQAYERATARFAPPEPVPQPAPQPRPRAPERPPTAAAAFAAAERRRHRGRDEFQAKMTEALRIAVGDYTSLSAGWARAASGDWTARFSVPGHDLFVRVGSLDGVHVVNLSDRPSGARGGAYRPLLALQQQGLLDFWARRTFRSRLVAPPGAGVAQMLRALCASPALAALRYSIDYCSR